MELRAETSIFDDKLLKEDINNAQETADDAQVIAGTTAQYFWFLEEIGSVPAGVGTGAHITNLTKEEFLYNPANGGGNLLARSNGIAIRDGLTELATFSADGASINRNGVSVALFGATARIGKTAGAHTTIDENGMQIYSVGSSNIPVEVASFGANQINLGQNNINSTISMCQGLFDITAYNSGNDTYVTLMANADAQTTSSFLDLEADFIRLKAEDIWIISDYESYNGVLMENGVLQITGGNIALNASTNNKAHVKVGVNGTDYVWLGVGSGGVNHGVYSVRNNKWIVFTDSEDVGTTWVGSGETSSGYINIDSLWGDVQTLKERVMDGGHETFDSIATNSYKTITVSYNETFTSAPNVTACLSTSGTAGNIGNVSVSVFDITRTNFKIRVFNNRGSALSPAVEWIAIGI